MAYDKAIDSAKLEQDLTAVADAIRASTGTEEPLEFPRGYVGAVQNTITLRDYLEGKIINYVDNVTTTLGLIYAWANNQIINSVKMTALQRIMYGTFSGCKAIESFYFPSLTQVDGYAFANCQKLTRLNLHNTTKIDGTNVFYGCAKLECLVIESETLCTLVNATNQFTNAPIAKGTGYIYVPAALVDEYKAATNWSAYASQFRAIEV